MFSDASIDAYAAAAYLVCRYPSSKPTSRLIASKSRITPLKATTIPRLELMGAVLSTRSLSIFKTLSIDQTFRGQIRQTFGTGSAITAGASSLL